MVATMKLCYACGRTLPRDAFYLRRKGEPYVCARCKDCSRVRFHDYLKENAPRLRENAKRWTAANPDKVRAKNRRHYAEHNVEVKASILLRKAVRDGVVDKPNSCSVCGKTVHARTLHGHHRDYSRPLDVVWLCHWCHDALHKSAALAEHETCPKCGGYKDPWGCVTCEKREKQEALHEAA